MKGNEIIVTGDPKGHFDSGAIYSALKPGRIVQIRAASGLGSDGRPVWADADTAGDGYPGACAVLLNDDLQGVLSTTAYVAGKIGKVYFPLEGEDMNIQLGDSGGTANSVAYGDLLMLDGEGGVLIPLSGDVAGPVFQAMESLTQVVDGTLCWVKRVN